jgi:soluble lytic murein transglycosylase-like protein
MVGERCEQITRKIGSRQLRDPDTNLAVGSLYLAALGDRHGDNWPLALAAFNAGPGNAKRWLDRFAGLGTASWVEHLTYPGTVGYLKRILSCVWPYWSLYFPALGSASPAVRIPETIPDTLSPYLDEEGGNCYTH